MPTELNDRDLQYISKSAVIYKDIGRPALIYMLAYTIQNGNNSAKRKTFKYFFTEKVI
jgi:hypothetical protein